MLNPILGRTEWNKGALMEALAKEPGGRGRYLVLCLACPSTEEMRVSEVAQSLFLPSSGDHCLGLSPVGRSLAPLTCLSLIWALGQRSALNSRPQ